MKKINELMTATEFAEACGVTRQTILRWRQNGKLKPSVITPGGKCLYDPSLVNKILGGDENNE